MFARFFWRGFCLIAKPALPKKFYIKEITKIVYDKTKRIIFAIK